jgi:hypothetical protein
VRKKDQSKKAVTRSVSLDPELVARIDARISAARPEIKGLSHYLQMLVWKDLQSAGILPSEKSPLHGARTVKVASDSADNTASNYVPRMQLPTQNLPIRPDVPANFIDGYPDFSPWLGLRGELSVAA